MIKILSGVLWLLAALLLVGCVIVMVSTPDDVNYVKTKSKKQWLTEEEDRDDLKQEEESIIPSAEAE